MLINSGVVYLKEGFSLFLPVVSVQFDVEFLYQFLCLLFLEVHDGVKHLQGGEVKRLIHTSTRQCLHEVANASRFQ